MHLNTSSRAEFFKIQFLDMKSNFCQRNKLQLKYFVQARFSNTGPFFWATRYYVDVTLLNELKDPATLALSKAHNCTKVGVSIAQSCCFKVAV